MECNKSIASSYKVVEVLMGIIIHNYDKNLNDSKCSACLMKNDHKDPMCASFIPYGRIFILSGNIVVWLWSWSISDEGVSYYDLKL